MGVDGCREKYGKGRIGLAVFYRRENSRTLIFCRRLLDILKIERCCLFVFFEISLIAVYLRTYGPSCH